MPHATLVAFTGFRVVNPALRELGMSLPGLQRRGEAIAALPPLGLLTVAAHTPRHWTQTLHKARHYDDALLRHVLAEQPALVAISALTASIDEAYAMCSALREHGIASVIGGLHATALPDEVLTHADAVVVGDGETSWPKVLRDAESGHLRGRYEGGACNLKESLLPRWDLLIGRHQRYTVQTARGCPLACEFCAASRMLGTFREKPATRVADELREIKARDPRAVIELADDNTFAGDREPNELLEVLAGAGLPWFTECDWRIGTKPGLARAMAQAGCAQVLVGVESQTHTYRGMGPKGVNAKRVFDAIEDMQDSGLAVIACFVAGADGETPDSLRQLGDLVANCPSADVQVTLQTPFPGAPLHKRLLRQGRMLKERSWRHHTLFELTFQPDSMTLSELETGYQELLSRTYSRDETRRRMEIRRAVWREKKHLSVRE